MQLKQLFSKWLAVSAWTMWWTKGVQIHGGMGYSAESLIERAYRDSRINRIFEGTNEINRMLTVDMILKKALKGELDLLGPAQAVAEELMGIPDFPDLGDGPLAQEEQYVRNFKKAVLMTAGAAAKELGIGHGKGTADPDEHRGYSDRHLFSRKRITAYA